MKDYLEKLVRENPLETSRKKYRMSKGRIYLNHLRAWMLLENSGMRLSEVWSLKLESIDCKNSEIHIKDVDSPGGKDHRRKKFRIRFRLKGAHKTERTAYIGKDLLEFLEKDIETRGDKECWFLDRGDGSNLYSSPNALGKAIERHQESLGIKGEAKRTHSYRATLLTELCRINPYSAQQQAGHADISTTIQAYAARTPENVKEALNQIKR